MPFFVRGLPAPQGSKRAYVRGGRAMLVESSAAVKPWRADVRAAALDTWTGPVLTGPVALTLHFRFDRPKGHYGKHGLLPSAPAYKVTAPDIDKLARATLDALTGIVFRDDAQVVELHVTKGWVAGDYPLPGCSVSVTAL